MNCLNRDRIWFDATLVDFWCKYFHSSSIVKWWLVTNIFFNFVPKLSIPTNKIQLKLAQWLCCSQLGYCLMVQSLINCWWSYWINYWKIVIISLSLNWNRYLILVWLFGKGNLIALLVKCSICFRVPMLFCCIYLNLSVHFGWFWSDCWSCGARGLSANSYWLLSDAELKKISSTFCMDRNITTKY